MATRTVCGTGMRKENSCKLKTFCVTKVDADLYARAQVEAAYDLNASDFTRGSEF